jgi:hypothetical protein
MYQCELAQKNSVQPPRMGGWALRVRIVLPYLNNADKLFKSMNCKPFAFSVDWVVYSAVLDSEARTPFKIEPGDNPTMELALEVYSESMDAIYNWNTFYLIIPTENETAQTNNEELHGDWEQDSWVLTDE